MTNRSPLSRFALTLEEIRAQDKMIEVVVFELCNDGTHRVSSFGKLCMEDDSDIKPPPLRFDEAYDGWKSVSRVPPVEMAFMGLTPSWSSHPGMNEEDLSLNGWLRDSSDAKVWSILFTVRREVASEILPPEQLRTALAECAEMRAAEFKEDSDNFDAWLEEAAESGLL